MMELLPRTRGGISLTMVLMAVTMVVHKPLVDVVDSILGKDWLPTPVHAARGAKFEGGLRRLGRDLVIRGEAPTRTHSSSRGIPGWNDLSGTTPRGSRRRGPGLTAVHLAPLPRSAFTQFVIAWPHAPRELATSPATSISSLHALIGDPATHALTLLRGPRNTPWLHSPLATIAR